MRVDGIGNQDRGNDLVARACDSDANDGAYVPMQRGRIVRLYEKDDDADDGKNEPGIRDPKSVFGCGTRRALFGRAIHPVVTEHTPELFTDDRSDDQAKELVPQLLGVEMEFLAKELGELDCDEDGAEEEGHGI